MYDVCVIGSGPAGYVAAIKASQEGFKTVCIEKDKVLGGTCLNVGCIPSKALLHRTELLSHVRKKGHVFGLTLPQELQIDTLMKEKEKVVTKLNTGIDYLFKKNKVERILGEANLQNDGSLFVNGTKIEAKYIIIATGSNPTPLPFLPFDEKKVLSSTGALSLDFIPKKMLVLGGGVIGLELGSVYQRLGSNVEVVEFMDRIIPEFDSDLSIAFQKTLENSGMKFNLKTKVVSAESIGSSVKLVSEDGKIFEGDVCLVSIGRRPNPHKMDVKLTPRGFIEVNANYETSINNVFAIGDVSGPPMLAHKGSMEAVSLIEFLKGRMKKINYTSIPNVIYSDPEVASAGFSESELNEKGIGYIKNSFPLVGNSRYQAIGGDDPCFVKALFHEKTKHLLGVHILAPNASEMIAQPSTAIDKKMTLEDLKKVCFAHPTLSEALHEVYLEKFLHI
jgi:dihydrolipoamide dehydrogenase